MSQGTVYTQLENQAYSSPVILSQGPREGGQGHPTPSPRTRSASGHRHQVPQQEGAQAP